MSKYNLLWQWFSNKEDESIVLTFDEIKEILGFELDHSFLNAKKELLDFGYRVVKISMKEEKVVFEKE